MDVTWHSFDFLTGRRGPQVVTRQAGSVSRIIGEPTTTTLDVLMWDEDAQAPVPGWDSATLPGRTMLVALDETERIEWGGFVTTRQAGSDAWASVSLATPEAYLDRRFVSDMAFTETDQATIAQELLEVADEAHFDTTGSAYRRDRTYLDDDDKTVLSVLTELMEVVNGPEFTCELEWTDDTHTAVKRVWVVRDRIGQASTARFEMPGSITDFTFTEDYSADNGANHVIAVSSGEGDVRPESDPQEDIAAGWRRFEHRFTPSTSITRKKRLNDHAQARLAAMRDGLAELTFEAHLDTAPRIGVDFHLGDDVEVVITAPRFPSYVDVNGARVPGLTKQMRVVGYTVDFDGNRLIPNVREVS